MLLNLAFTTSFLVGIVFLLTGIAKVIEPWKFIRHIAQLGLLNQALIVSTSIAFIAIESALGMALILGVFPKVIIPLSILLLVGLSILTYWSTSTGKTEDCACYNGWLEISPSQSLILNFIYISLLVVAEFLGKYQVTVLWQWVAVLITFITSFALAAGSLEYMQNSSRPYIDFSPLQKNKIWQLEWLGEDSKSLMSGSVILVFMSPQCPQCKNWLKVLKFLQRQDDLPNVAGVVALSNLDEGQDFVDNYALNFPVAVVEQELYKKLRIEAVPTAVVLEDGVIQDKWIGSMPVWFVDKIRQINQR
ncbi:MAG: hypothetical protein F6K54_18490 [Okeania sp. SIO3B5]|uniref:MauE/DoxX family redox-associated membrane protein n=1 Tax=Okeania sp. SIO3B5 TaxID=2607811 RepID=UPI0013FE8213|nr:MauE/DoxX family redox-associated membrane protein [Okeania sp. SIO3B5]NEO54891.1 hypothetical protein [Okeania sp. SIO3B5]